jgi:hypothetical protein
MNCVERNIALLEEDYTEWTTLRAWGCYLADVEVVYKPRAQNTGCHGHYQPWRHRITLFVGRDIDKCRATLLHEMAHAAFHKTGCVESGRSHHGPGWRQIYASAATELLGEWGFQDNNNLRLTGNVRKVFELCRQGL